MPGSEHGIPDWAPTLADLLKEEGYVTAQYGKNHLGDQDNHLPTAHGFDEFFGNLYHLNAEEEPETYYYPQDPAFREQYGPRGVIRSTADGEIEDTGPMTRERMETADEEFLEAGMDFVERAVESDTPFFMWFNATRMHVWTRLKEESIGVTGVGLYPDGMVEHDGHVGQLLNQLDELGVADNTIVIYSTDNGAETATWPDGGITPFHGEKGTTWEGGFRVPAIVRWPDTVEPGTKVTDIMSHEDWIPTLMAAIGQDDIVDRLQEGYRANGTDWRVHLDGYNFLPFLSGEADSGPREEVYYFSQGGELNAVRWQDWKVHFAKIDGNIATGIRTVPGWPVIINLKADPYERMWEESEMYIRWYGDNMWLFVPIQAKIQEFLGTLEGYPFQQGSTLSASGINYNSLRALQILQELQRSGFPVNR
jgi:arylsulfatase